jgi:SAM-dependent methyltransferase
MSTGVAGYYDRLSRWNRVARVIGYGGGQEALTVHRALADPRVHGRPTFTRLHDIIVARLSGKSEPRVLDAGCGLGGTMLALCDSLAASCTGLTLSSTQAAIANDAAERRGYAKHMRALVQSYDAPPDGPFDLIVAIESLAHSTDPARSVGALSRVLVPGGRLVIVDDMPEPVARDSAELAALKAGWQCPVLWSAQEYRDSLTALGLELTDEIDLTIDMRPRSKVTVGLLMILNRCARPLVGSSMRQILDSHAGGLVLERLAAKRLVRYQLIVARRPELQVS